MIALYCLMFVVFSLYCLMLVAFAYFVKTKCDDIYNCIDNLEVRVSELEYLLLDDKECLENEIGAE